MSDKQYNMTDATYNGGFNLSTMKDGKRVFDKMVEYVGFTLAAIVPGFDKPYALVAKEIGDGDNKKTVHVPEFEDSKINYLQEALTARVEAAAKGRVNGGNEPYGTLEEILDSTGGGQYKKLQSEFKAAIAAMLEAAGKPEALCVAVVKLLEPDVLRNTSEGNKAKIKEVIGAYTETDEEGAAKYSSVITRVLSATESEEPDLSDL